MPRRPASMGRIHGKSYDASCCTEMDNGLLEAQDREKPNRSGDSDSKFRVSLPLPPSHPLATPRNCNFRSRTLNVPLLSSTLTDILRPPASLQDISQYGIYRYHLHLSSFSSHLTSVTVSRSHDRHVLLPSSEPETVFHPTIDRPWP